MKGIFKFMTVALAAGMVASCSDDLGLESAKYSAGKGDMTATILAPQDLTTRLAVYDNGGVAKAGIGIDGKKFAWKTGEEVRVFSLNQTAQDIYKCNEGGSLVADFTQVVNANLTGKKYAVTESDMIYGISATTKDKEGNLLEKPLPLLTLTIPNGRDEKTYAVKNAWKPEQETPGVTNGKNFPVPFWGEATISGTPNADGVLEEGATLNTAVQGLTAYMRVNLDALPKGTKYIVLTTHGGGIFKPEAGFILAPNTRVAQDATQEKLDARDTWYKDGTDDPQEEDEWITGGASEPLSGTFNAILDPEKAGKDVDKSEWPVLGPDSRLVPSDELIVDIQGLTKKIFYIPVICNTYKSLHVIAATGISNAYRYCYAGTELKLFRDKEFVVNQMYYLDMNLIKLPKACIADVNSAIKANCGTAGMTTIIDVDTLYYATDGDYHKASGTKCKHTSGETYAIGNEYLIDVNVEGNVVLNIAAIGKNSDGDLIGSQKAIDGLNKRPLIITDVRDADNLPAEYTSGSAVNDDGIRRTVEINVPSDWYLASEEPQNGFMKVVTTQRDVILGTIDADKANLVSVDVVGSDTKLDNTYEMSATVSAGRGKSMKVLDPTQAAIIIRDGFFNVNVEENHLNGDVFVYTNYSEWETEIDSLDIQTREKIGIRLDDALVNSIKFSKNPLRPRDVYTTGSSAIANVYADKDKAFKTTGSDAHPISEAEDAAMGENTNVPALVTMYSYWTGAALSPRAIDNTYEDPVKGKFPKANINPEGKVRPSYDQTNVFTVAQLASVGEGIYASNKISNHQVGKDDVLPKVSEYQIPKALFGHFWLGSTEYPWIGARARIDGFKLDGQETELKNMNMIVDWNDATTKVDDPHWCCTSCWTPDSNTPKIDLKKDFGLVRFVENSDTVTFQYVNLNDPEVLTKKGISNVGAVVGRISSKAAGLLHNRVGETKIKTAGDNVAGVAGLVELGWGNKTNEIAYEADYLDEENTEFKAVVEEGGILTVIDNVVSGRLNHSGFVNGKSYAGGVVGKVKASEGVETKATEAIIEDNYVALNYDKGIDSKAEGPFEGGVSASADFAGGIVAYVDASENIDASFNNVDIAQNIHAGGSFAGGIAAYAQSDATLQGDANVVKVTGKIESAAVVTELTTDEGCAGGIAGRSDTKGDTEYNNNEVNVGTIIADKRAGGIVARLTQSKGDLDLLENYVRANDITVTTHNGAAGLVGELINKKGSVYVDDNQENYNYDASLKEDMEMVIVKNAISAGNMYAGGLLGDVKLANDQFVYIKAAQVKANTIKATNGFVGGFVGEMYTGGLQLGVEGTDFTKDYGKIVEVDNMQGRLDVGGVLGTNLTATATPVNVITSESEGWKVEFGQWPPVHYKNYLNINVKDWKKIGSNLREDEVKQWGTFGNIIGEQGDKFYVNNDITTVEDYDLLKIVENLTPAKKEAVGYKKHNDNGHNVSDFNNPDWQYYWGDENGYVGYERNGTYTIGTLTSKGEQVEWVSPNDAPQHNVYKKLAIYSEGSKYAE